MAVDPSTVRGPHNTPCQHCGLMHGKLCPSVKAYEYHPDGSLKRVEFREAVARFDPGYEYVPGGVSWVKEFS